MKILGKKGREMGAPPGCIPADGRGAHKVVMEIKILQEKGFQQSLFCIELQGSGSLFFNKRNSFCPFLPGTSGKKGKVSAPPGIQANLLRAGSSLIRPV
jgi:hypothetical protein